MIGILWSVHNTHTHTHEASCNDDADAKQPHYKAAAHPAAFYKHDSCCCSRGAEENSWTGFICKSIDPSLAHVVIWIFHSNYYVQSWIFMGFVEAQLSSAQLSSIDRSRGTIVKIF